MLQQRFTNANQAHVLTGLYEGSEDEKQKLANQLENLNLDFLKAAIDKIDQPSSECPIDIESSLQPPPTYPKANWEDAHKWHFSSSKSIALNETPEKNRTERWFNIGLQLISENKTAVVVLAGGQGTRLGSAAPQAKGMLDIGLPSGRSLFQLQAERILRIQFLASKAFVDSKPQMLWIVLTSDATDAVTKEFFALHNFFGLNPSQILFVKQPNMPCISIEQEDGHHKLLLDDCHHVAESPDGNGSIFETFYKSGLSKRMEDSGILYVQVYAVDNALIKVGDPVFFGYCKERNAEIGVKVVSKVNPKESVGVVCLKSVDNGTHNAAENVVDEKRYGVVEYSEMTEKLRNLKDENGKLAYNAAHICINLFSVKFLNRFDDSGMFSLPYHAARKKIPFVKKNEVGNWQLVHPSAPNGIKFEKFIFDSFLYCDPNEVAILEVERNEEFGPIKNPNGENVPDTPDTAKSLLLDLHNLWMKKNSELKSFISSEQVNHNHLLEISPRVSYCGEFVKSN